MTDPRPEVAAHDERRKYVFDTMTKREPATEAGRAFDLLWPGGMNVIDRLTWRESILAIEEQAARLATPSERLCGCTVDSDLPDTCPVCHHREHGASGCKAILAHPATPPEGLRRKAIVEIVEEADREGADADGIADALLDEADRWAAPPSEGLPAGHPDTWPGGTMHMSLDRPAPPSDCEHGGLGGGTVPAYSWCKTHDGYWPGGPTCARAPRPAPPSEVERLREVLMVLQGAFNALWSNGPVIDTIAEWGRDWTHDPDPAFYDLLDTARQAVDAVLASTEPSAD